MSAHSRARFLLYVVQVECLLLAVSAHYSVSYFHQSGDVEVVDPTPFCTGLMKLVQSQYSKPGGERNPLSFLWLATIATTECGGIVAVG